MFNIAGIEGEFEMTGGASTENWDNVMKVNASSVFLNMKYVLSDLLQRSGGGAVVSTGAPIWRGTGPGWLGPYCASKHAVVGMTKERRPSSMRAKHPRQRRPPELGRDGDGPPGVGAINPDHRGRASRC